jgi:hypothetical protein
MLSLTKKEKNDIFVAIEKTGLDPHKFRWEIRPSNLIQVYRRHEVYDALSGYEFDMAETLLTGEGSQEFFFTFERNQDGVFLASLFPHINVGTSVQTQRWQGLSGAFNEWLDVVKYELKETDLWGTLPHNQVLTAIPKSYSNEEQFSPSEVLQLRERLLEIEKFIVQTNRLTGSAKAQVHQTFVYLQRKAETATKLDWKNIFAGAIVSLVLSLAVENAPAIFKLCDELLSPLFRPLLA